MPVVQILPLSQLERHFVTCRTSQGCQELSTAPRRPWMFCQSEILVKINSIMMTNHELLGQGQVLKTCNYTSLMAVSDCQYPLRILQPHPFLSTAQFIECNQEQALCKGKLCPASAWLIANLAAGDRSGSLRSREA